MQTAGVAYDLRALATTKKVGLAFSGKQWSTYSPDVENTSLYSRGGTSQRHLFCAIELHVGAENFKNKSKTLVHQIFVNRQPRYRFKLRQITLIYIRANNRRNLQ